MDSRYCFPKHCPKILFGTSLAPNKLPKETMEEESRPAQPVISEYQGKPIIRVPTVDNPNPDTTWHWLSFGKNKAKAIVKFYDAIKKFAEE
jgi:hypothetical protein